MAVALDGIGVLIADDDADAVDLLRWIVTLAGASVKSAYSGREALAIVSAWKPDVLLLDIAMPDMDGCELLGAIRREPGVQRVPAVAVTGCVFVQDRARVARAGFDAFVAKPFEVETLLELVGTLTRPRVGAAEVDLGFRDRVRARAATARPRS